MLAFFKSAPTTWVMQFRNGTLIREGAGLSFWYWAPTTTLISVPVSSEDVPFVFTETTADFQTVTVQGQLTYRVSDAKKLASLLDYSVDRKGRRLSDDPQKVPERLVHAAHVQTRASVQPYALKEVLVRAEQLEREVFESLRTAPAVTMLGVEVLALNVFAVSATPEMARALEAEAREALQRESDEAIYARRNAAVESERQIKESELQTEVLVEQKKRHIRETKMAADIAVEAQREQLIEQTVANDKKAADSKAYALKVSLEPLRDLDWKTLQTLTSGGMDPKVMIATAFRELAQNAEKIGELNMSPDLLRSLVEGAAPVRR